MAGHRLFTSLLAAVLLTGLAAMLPLAWTGADALKSSYREYAVRDITANARLAARLLGLAEAGGREEPEGLLRQAGQDSYTRYTVVRADGSVMADSEESPARMENHANRPEVKKALSGEVGIDIRHSPTLGTDWIYAAIPLGDGRVMRAAAALGDVDSRLHQWWRRAGTGLAVSLAVLAVLAFLAARFLSRPLEAAARAAEQYAQGDFSVRPPQLGSAETRRLAASLGVMATELDARFKLINRQKDEMRAVFDNMDEGVLAVDADGRLLLHNRAAAKLIGIPESAVGRELGKIARVADLLDLIRTAQESRTAASGEIRLVPGQAPKAPETLALVRAVTMAPAGGGGFEQGGRVLVVMRDITRMRRLEVIRRDFVANVSHELRTPVTTIQSCLETIEDEGGLPGAGEPFLRMAMRNTRRLGAIIDNLLLLAGIESGRRGADDSANPAADASAVYPVKPILADAVALCMETAREKNAHFTVVCEDELTARLVRPLIEHALVNLLDNSVKYGPVGGEITVSARADGDVVRIEVADNGPGIAPAQQERVFERFYRAPGTARSGEGVGLGLSLVKHIVQAQGGMVTLRSEVGRGSVFCLTLPGS